MIDMHSHILPDLDDGSSSIDQSIRMLQILKESLVTSVVATPHFYLHKTTIKDFIQNRDIQYNKLTAGISAGELPKIVKGAEVLLTTELTKIDNLNELCIEGTRYILLEMPYTFWGDWVYHSVYEIVSKHRLCPILAHVERYFPLFKDKKVILKLLSLDVLAQVNADSLASFRTRSTAISLLKSNLAHVIGSDTHNDTTRPPLMSKASKIINKKLGKSIMDNINKNSQLILNNQSIFNTRN